MPSHTSARPDISKLVEKQMRNWEIARSQRPSDSDRERASPVEDFVAISRTPGAGGNEVGNKLAERLGWPLFDREILQHMAGDDEIRARLYRTMDEHDTTWLEDILRWVLRGDSPREDYFHRLTETVLALARLGRTVFVGRAADLILPADRGLRVWIVAPRHRRIQSIADRGGLTYAQAEQEIDRIERDRQDFIRRHFEADPLDPTRFDLTLSMTRLSPDRAVELILAAMAARGMDVN